MRRSALPRTARAFAPGHITGIFAPVLEPFDPRARGSVGAGVVLDLGVRAQVRYFPTKSRRLVFRSDARHPLPISLDVAHRLFTGSVGRLEVALEHDLPIGQGFGMSAAGALSTALAVSAVLDRPPDQVASAAHLADFFGGGGLGGVSAILAGGLELRRKAGVPPWGEVRHRAFPYPIFLSVVGPPMPSPPLLGDARFLQRVRKTADGGIVRLNRSFTAPAFLREASAFSDRLALTPPSVAWHLKRLRIPGVVAGQAMFGQALWAVPTRPAARRALIDLLQELKLPTVEVRAATVRGVPSLSRGHRAPPRPPSLR